MKRAIVTGFGPFGSYRSNPTGELAKRLQFGNFAGHYMYGREIPANIFPRGGQKILYGEMLVRLAMEQGVHCIVSLGIDSCAKGFRVETVAKNLIQNEKYCPPSLNGHAVLAERPLGEKICLPKYMVDFSALKSRFSAVGVPLEPEMSTDAGGYCCNALMYMVLRAQVRLKQRIPFVFCHVPCTKKCIEGISDFDPAKILISEEELEEGLRQILVSF